jgi:protein LSM14
LALALTLVQAPYASSYYSTQQQAYSNVNYRAPYGSNVMNQSNGYWQNATNTITGTTATATGPTPASVFSNQAQQQQQFFYHHHHHQQPQQPRFQMPVPENYQVVPSSNAASSAVESTTTTTTSFNQTLPGNYTVDTLSNKTSPKKQDEKQDKTVAPIFSEKEAVSAVIVSKTGMQASTSQEKEEVAVIEQVDEVLVDSLVKQVSDLDIKQPVQESCSKSTSRNIKEKQAIRKQQDSSRQKTIVKEGNGRKSDGGKQPSKHNSTSRAITTNNNSNVSEAISQTETKSSREGDAQRTRELNSQRNSNNGGARRNSSNNRNNNGGIVIPKVDFDFASSNAKFDKTIIAKDDALDNENETVTIPEADHFYDKVGLSISCFYL